MNSRPKNIVIVVHHYPPHVTGVGVIAQNHAKRLATLGHTVTVITSQTSPQEKSYVADGVKVVCIPALNISEKWGAPFPIFSPMLLPALFKYIRKADIVHVHDAFYMSSFAAVLIAKLYRKSVILTQHVAMIAHPSKFVVAMEKLVYATTGAVVFKLSTLILIYNDRVEAFLIKQGVPQEKILPLHNGVDNRIFYPVDAKGKKALRKKLGFDPDKKIILFVGRFVPKKGFDKVLAVRSDEYQIVCAGGDIPKEAVPNVTFLGKLNQWELAEVYQASDIFLLPSESEGFPLSIQEAMACRLPIITSYDPGYKRYNLDDSFVYLIDNPTEASIRHAIESVLNNETKLSEMAAYSEEYTKTHFNWDAIISKLDSFYADSAK